MGIDEKVIELKENLIKDTQRVLQIKSVMEEAKEGMPFGEGVAKALDCALKISEELGFKTKNIDGRVGYAEYGEGEEYVAVLGHLDVVPEGDGWVYDPYSAAIADNKIYARGALDDKGPTMAALYGLKAIKDLNLPLSKKVRVIFGTAEEVGGNDIPYYLEREKAPIAGFTPDAEFPIIFAEKGIIGFKAVKDLIQKSDSGINIKYIKGGNRANMVPDYCEALITAKDENNIVNYIKEFTEKTGYEVKFEIKEEGIIIKTFGVSAHGAMPYKGKNAIMGMFKFLGTLPLGECDAAEYIHCFNDNFGFDTDGKRAGVNLKDKPSGELTLNLGVVEVNEDRASMTFNIRYPVTFTYEDVMVPLNKVFEVYGIGVENFGNAEPLYYPQDHPLINTLQSVYTKATNKEATLLAIGGGTYAKEMPNIVAFGPIFPGKPDLDHQPNEYIEIEDLITCARIYGNAIYELAK